MELSHPNGCRSVAATSMSHQAANWTFVASSPQLLFLYASLRAVVIKKMAYGRRTVSPYLAALVFYYSFLHGLLQAIPSSMAKGCLEAERDSLLIFKAGILEDPSNRLSSWHGRDCCRWSGVVCDNGTGHVVELNLQDDNYFPEEAALGGKISPSLLSLTHLDRLNLSRNDFGGIQIPEFIGSFNKLRFLDLSYAGFSGTIPLQLGNLSSLRYLDLSTNENSTRADQLEWLLRLSSLRYLRMDYVNLSKASHNWLPVINMLPSLQELHLSYCELGSIPSSLSRVNLTALTTLDLSDNLFNSTLPKWLWELGSSLLYLDLGYAEFYGAIPDDIGNLTSLTALVLAGNDGLDGGTMMILGNLFSLKSIDLGSNNLTGGFPAWLLQMTNLTHLDLSDNSLTGPLPAEIGKLPNLSYLDVSYNSLEGDVSQLHFANLATTLQALYLSGNSLTIAIDDNWDPPLQLKYIGLGSCKLGGPRFPGWLRWQRSILELDLSNTSIQDTLPNWLWNASSPLRALDVSHNRISGTLPTSLEGMTKLKVFNLSSNLLEGSVPALPHSIRLLDLSSNSLSGPLPPTLLAPNLSMLSLSDNHITGSMPSYLCDLTYLYYLDLSNNQISGGIPQCWKSSEHYFINLANNKLSGGIPSYMANVFTKYLFLSNNSLSGELPPSFRNCSSLTILDLGENKLSGKIPTWMGEYLQYLAILRLRSNMFSGKIPSQLGLLRKLQIMDLADNQLSGSIPHSFNNLSAMVSIAKSMSIPSEIYLSSFNRFVVTIKKDITIVTKGQAHEYSTILQYVKSIDLSNNNLTGEIPRELGALVALQTLNLSKNNIGGKIPDTIGRMLYLETLDLSFNMLSGVIPQSLSTLTSLSHLNVSYNNLSGGIPSGNQLQTLADPLYIYIGNAYLCGSPILKNCSAVVVDEEEEANDGSQITWFSLSSVLGFLVGLWGVYVVLLYNKAWRNIYFHIIDNMYDKLNVVYLAKLHI